jgi:flagellar biogenesis protein FliO
MLIPTRHARSIAAALTVVAWCLSAVAEAPIAPAPELLIADAAVVPASVVEAATAAGPAAARSLAPVPLSTEPQPSVGSRTPAFRPLPDWRLLVALGSAFAAVAVYRVVTARRSVGMPPDVFEVLGEASLGGQQSVRIIRFGPRTLLVGVSSAGCQTLAELTDPQATDRMVAACHGSRVAGVADRGRRAARRGEARA